MEDLVKAVKQYRQSQDHQSVHALNEALERAEQVLERFAECFGGTRPLSFGYFANRTGGKTVIDRGSEDAVYYEASVGVPFNAVQAARESM
jgi:hypothetical protein